MHSDAQLTLFSSFSLGKISKLLLRSLVRRFAGSSSVKFLFLLCTRQNKQVSFTLAYASVPAHVEMMGFLGIGNNPMVGAPKRQGCATQLRYRSWYRWRIEQVIYCNSIDLWRVVLLNGSLFYCYQMSSWAQAKDLIKQGENSQGSLLCSPFLFM